MEQKTYTCLLCGRNKFTRKTSHICGSQYRKHKITWKENETLQKQNINK